MTLSPIKSDEVVIVSFATSSINSKIPWKFVNLDIQCEIAVNKNIEPCFGCRPRSGFSCLWSSLISLDSFSVPELLIKFRPSLVAIGKMQLMP